MYKSPISLFREKSLNSKIPNSFLAETPDHIDSDSKQIIHSSLINIKRTSKALNDANNLPQFPAKIAALLACNQSKVTYLPAKSYVRKTTSRVSRCRRRYKEEEVFRDSVNSIRIP